MPVRAIAVALLLLAGATGLGGCSGPPPADLFVVTRTGTIPGARLTLRITDDGGAYCNRLGRREMTSAQLIQARALAEALNGRTDSDVGLAEKHLHLRPGRVTTMSYTVLSEKGTVTFSDTSAHQPKEFYELAQLTRGVAKGSCHLAR